MSNSTKVSPPGSTLTPKERAHVLALDKFFSGDFSTPATQASALRHAEAYKRMVTPKPIHPDPLQRSPYD